MKTGSITSERRFGKTKLMILNEAHTKAEFTHFRELGKYLNPNDLIVMNISGTVPGSFLGEVNGSSIEIRLAAFAGTAVEDFSEWWAIAFGEGSWRMPTEDRGLPEKLKMGDLIRVSEDFFIKILEINSRVMKIRFEGKNIFDKIYRNGRAIQYSYHKDALPLWDVQTLLSQVPISVEAPSALFPFDWNHFFALSKICKVAFLYHGAGISSTGDEKLDELLPLSEFFSIPQATIDAVLHAKKSSGRIIAVGTSVVRALESAFERGLEQAKVKGITTLKLKDGDRAKITDGLLTGFHEPQTSHFQLESAILPKNFLMKTYMQAEKRGFIGHEYGDAVLLLRKTFALPQKSVRRCNDDGALLL